LRPSGERLEERALLAVPGYDYALSGFQWSNPAHLTYSIAPDGVYWDHGTNALNATFDAQMGEGTWQRPIARALASWESVANLNIAEVSDGPYDLNTLGLAQGDPRFGDIRIGGYQFPGDTTTLAQTYEPPPNGATAAGDVELNLALKFNIGSDFDLYSALLHETGHALGLAHAQNPASVMYPNYQGVRMGLSPGDIAGIQAIYGARTTDWVQGGGQGLDFATAVDLSSALAHSQSTSVAGLSLASIGDSEYFRVVAPVWGGTVLQVTAAAGNISLLSPKVELYNSAQQLLAQASNPEAWGDDATVSFPGIVGGQAYTIVVTGATGDVFDAGAYQLTVRFPGASLPVTPVSQPPSSAPAGPADLGNQAESNQTMATATPLGSVSQVALSGLIIAPSAPVAWFSFQAARPGNYRVRAPREVIRIFNARARWIAGASGTVGFRVAQRGSTFYVEISSPNGSAAGNQPLTISINKVSTAFAHRVVRHHARTASSRPSRHATGMV
jgi:hypothetical protein